MGGVLNAKRITLFSAAAIFIGIGAVPLAAMIVSSLEVAGHITVQNYVDVLGNTRTWILFRNSLVLGVLTTAATAVLGIPLGIVLAKTSLPLRRTFVAAFTLPLVLPPYIFAVGWNEIVRSAWLFSSGGAVLVLGTAFLPIVLLLTLAYIRNVNPALEEAARLTNSWPAVIARVTIPLAAPGILLGLLLVFLLTMGEFGVPMFLRLEVFSAASFIQFSAFYNFGAATASAMPLVIVALAVLSLEKAFVRGKQFQFGWKSYVNFETLTLGRKVHLVFLLVAVIALVLVGIPLSAVVWRGLSPGALDEALRRAGPSALRSLAYSSVSATALTGLGFFLGYLVHRQSIAQWRWIEAVALFLFVVPGTVIGIGLIFVWNRPATNWMYATPLILVMGYLAQYMVVSTRTISAGLSQLSPSVEEAAEIAGVSWFGRIFFILAPMLRPVVFASWALTFVFCVRDLNLSLLLAPVGYDTLTSRTMTLMANGSRELIAGLCALSIALTLGSLCVVGAIARLWSASHERA